MHRPAWRRRAAAAAAAPDARLPMLADARLPTARVCAIARSCARLSPAALTGRARPLASCAERAEP
jgi:hypothetical protein